MGRAWKRWIDNVKVCLRNRGLVVRQARKMVQDRSEWVEAFAKGNAWGVAWGLNLRP